MRDQEPLVVAVDVGGSGLRLTVDAGGTRRPVLAAPGVRVGPGGIDVSRLVTDARRLLESASATGGPAVVVWSMRGLILLADRQAVLRTVAEGFGARHTVVVSDAVAGLVGAVGALVPAAAVSAGTGAVAFGTDFADRWQRVDGWGHVLGDTGSAAWLGLEGLRAGLRAADGLPGGSAALLEAAAGRLGPPEGWPRLVMTGADAPERLASVAPLVTEAAATDPVASRICHLAGTALAESLLAASAGLDDPVLVATGGVLAAPVVAAALDARLAASGAHRTAAQGGAIDGALLLGREVAAGRRIPEHPVYVLHRHDPHE
jgi:N-acetylglucosamine kinase-like BadF-type ATPase